MTLTHVHSSEREDFEIELRRRKRPLDDFDLSDTPWRIDPPGALSGPTVGSVTIKCRKTGTARTYSTGGINISTDPLIRWVREFVQDLDAGVFD